MSFWVYLTDDSGNMLSMSEPHDFAGGTYVLGGTATCELNVTYNYGEILTRVLGEGSISTLHGRSAMETIPALEFAISNLGDDEHPDYWQPTEGNAKLALASLLVFARAHADGVWSVS